MICRTNIRGGHAPEVTELTLGQAVNDILVTIGTRDEVWITGNNVIYLLDPTADQVLLYEELESGVSSLDEFVRLWCFARVVQVFLNLHTQRCTDTEQARELARRYAYGRQVPVPPSMPFEDIHALLSYGIQWILGRSVGRLNLGSVEALELACDALAKEIDGGVPLEETLAMPIE